MQLDSSDVRRTVLVLTKLLRDELGEARFRVARLAGSDAEFVPGEFGGSTTTTLEETSREEFDAAGLRAIHDAGDWKRGLFRSDVRVQSLPGGPGSAARRAEFDRLLDVLGVLADGHVAHALGPLLPGYHAGVLQRDSPEEQIGVAESGDLWNYLVIDACLSTPRRTAGKVLCWVRGVPLAFETRVLLGRLQAVKSFVLAGGLAVERLPLGSKDLEGLLPAGPGKPASDYLGRTLLRIPCTIAPVLSKPKRVTRKSARGVPTTSWEIPARTEAAWPLPLGGIHELARALSLVCDVAVETPMTWADYGGHAHFGEQHGKSFSGTGELPPRQARESPLTARYLREAVRMQPALCNLPRDVEIALRYWLKSKARGLEVPDALVFVRTALEALFLDRGNDGELAYRLSTNGAWYTGRNREERRNRFDALKKVYRAASGAVHGRGAGKGDTATLKDGQAICRQAILKRIRTAQAPVWRDIVFGR